MGVPDNSLLDLIDKIRSWGSRGELSSYRTAEFVMANNLCSECELNVTELCHKYSCQGCRRLLCGSCVRTSGSLVIITTSNGSKDVDHIEKVTKACKFCSKSSKRHIEKVYPSESPRASPEPLLPHGDGKIVDEDCVPRSSEFWDHSFSPHKMSSGRYDGHPSQASLRESPIQSDEEPEESRRHFFSTSSDYYHDSSDIDTGSVSFRHESCSFRSAGSSPLDSPSRFNINTPRDGLAVQQPRGGNPKPQSSSPPNQGRMAILRRPDGGTVDPENTDSQSDEMTIIVKQDEKFVKSLDFENNDHIWFPPPPEDEDDEAESNYFQYEDDDEEDHHANVVEHSFGMFSSWSSPSNLFSTKGKQNEEQREPMKAVINGHFRALVSQLLQEEGIKFGTDNGTQDWLNIVSTLAWQAASFVKPYTSKGGSMDPGHYVKIKCVASGSPNESTLIKGVVCTKNIKHKRMTSQYKNPRLLLLGGSLEYQRAQNQLASFNTLLEEEMNHLKMIVSKIEAHRPNVLLVEKTVSSYAQEYLLEKEISLVLNVKRPLLERIARCTGALIIPYVDKISVARVGHCELFRLERVSEELKTANQSTRRPSKTLMYFEGCPRRLGCTVMLKGLCREELKKIKYVIQYAVFAAYHLSLETSFLADEGAHLPKITSGPSNIPDTVTPSQELVGVVGPADGVVDNTVYVEWEPASDQLSSSEALPVDSRADNMSHQCWDGSICNAGAEPTSPGPDRCSPQRASTVTNPVQSELLETVFPPKGQSVEMDKIDENGVSSDHLAAAESQRSILVTFSSHCVSKGALCERSRLLRIRFYGSFDKPLGKYLRDDLFDQSSLCRSCKEPMEAHVQCYTHRQGSLTINVSRLDKLKLPGERDGKIWMWHRCLKCAQIDGVPPATRRVIMSDAAWGLSFGKFLELSFSNHATANRVATCGHSLQRDCLRFYGFGSMVAFFHYSPIDILTVHLPPSVLEFNGHSKRDWIKKEVEELKGKMENLYAEISDVLCLMEQKSASLGNGSSDPSDLHKCIREFKDLLDKERDDYCGLLQQAQEESSQFDILELNRLRRSLLIGSRAWERRLYSLDSLLNSKSFTFDASDDTGSHASIKELKNDLIKDSKLGIDQAENALGYTETHISVGSYVDSYGVSQQGEVHGDGEITASDKSQGEVHGDGEITASDKSSESVQFPASNLSDKIDSAWTGTDVEASQAGPVGQVNQVDNLPLKRLMAPKRLYSFDSAMRIHEKLHRGLAPSHLSAVRSFHASGDYRNMIRDPTPSVVRMHSSISSCNANFTPSFISSVSRLSEGSRLLLPQTGLSDLVIAVYDDEPTSVISYALISKDYDDWVSDKMSQHDGSSIGKDITREDTTASPFLNWQALGSLDLDYINYGSFGSEDVSPRSMLFGDPKKSPHLHISFDDDSSCAGGKAKFLVTCYFAKQFDMLRMKCCPSKVDFVCSLSRCRRWSAQGGKSNVYFAKSMDERFIIKQVTKTELESFQEFAPEYFKYLNDSLDSGSPSCLAKIFGIFQVTIKHIKGARETKMDLMVMENIFFERRISRIYDLKGSLRSRYNSDTTGANKVLLDMNLLETLRTSPIFLGSKAKRRLERAVWNDTSFLASVYVMDYSLLVGVDEERKELVLGIIDFMRQYTWDKQLETWVKASGILGGPKNASPTIISPKQYKRRFRKAMTTYFLTVPDQWSS